MSHRMLAINIDGTLLRSNGRLQKGIKEAVDFVKKRGVYITLVTNRNFPSAKKIAKALKLDGILVTHGGAFIASSIDQPIINRRISQEKTFNLVQVLENFECTIRILHERYSLGNRVNLNNNIVAKAVFNSGDPLFYPMQFVESLGDTLRDEPVSTPKIDVYFKEQEELERAKVTIENAFEGIHVYTDRKLKLEVVSEPMSKDKGLELLAGYLGIDWKEIVVIGDSSSDLKMIERAGLGVAMGNATDEVKRAAKWVTRTNDQNGVSYMVMTHFRKQLSITTNKQ
ncbi:Cof-type HAD-IIB family hydrolase [Bacillus suaedaesalsae]|uniref:HAD family phosphatase n=1 Tax=Bacillus suaedaesalsae TaxID=2810349 RepID=A0ABS2DH33_9BACI|nr:Cof-type HAD-IIB family hydrolase [Bacillus suaedaesalsae]MBM6617783.1 HAD family phosphatase [Bacillus suaedaesalsae]